MQWIRGQDLDTYLEGLKRNQMLSVRRSFFMARKLAHAVVYLNNKTNIVHGDIRPRNLILRRDSDDLVIIDFGSAWGVEQTVERDNGDGWTRPYSAPERLNKSPFVDFRSDQFSVSVVFYQLLTRDIPYQGRGGLTPPSQKREDRQRLPPRLWKKIDAVVTTGLAQEPNDRYPNPGAWIQALNDIYADFVKLSQLSPANRAMVNIFDWIADRFPARGR